MQARTPAVSGLAPLHLRLATYIHKFKPYRRHMGAFGFPLPLHSASQQPRGVLVVDPKATCSSAPVRSPGRYAYRKSG